MKWNEDSGNQKGISACNMKACERWNNFCTNFMQNTSSYYFLTTKLIHGIDKNRWLWMSKRERNTTQQYTRWKFQRRWTFSPPIVSRPQSKRHFLTMISSEVPSQWYRKGFSYDSSFQQHTTQPADHSRTFSPASHFLFWIAVYKIAAPIHNIPERTLTLFSSFPYTNTKPLSFSLYCFRR